MVVGVDVRPSIGHACKHHTNTYIHIHTLRTRDVVRVRVRVDGIEGLEPHLLQEGDVARHGQVDGVDDDGLLACVVCFFGYLFGGRGRGGMRDTGTCMSYVCTSNKDPRSIHNRYMYNTYDALSGSERKYVYVLDSASKSCRKTGGARCCCLQG